MLFRRVCYFCLRIAKRNPLLQQGVSGILPLSIAAIKKGILVKTEHFSEKLVLSNVVCTGDYVFGCVEEGAQP
jgi:hypothetical protein